MKKYFYSLVCVALPIIAIPQGDTGKNSPTYQAEGYKAAKAEDNIKKIDSCHVELKINVDILINRGVLPDSLKIP